MFSSITGWVAYAVLCMVLVMEGWPTVACVQYTVKKKQRAMHTKYGVLLLSHLEHLIWREVTPNFWCVFYTKLGVLSHQVSVLSH